MVYKYIIFGFLYSKPLELLYLALKLGVQGSLSPKPVVFSKVVE